MKDNFSYKSFQVFVARYTRGMYRSVTNDGTSRSLRKAPHEMKVHLDDVNYFIVSSSKK